MVKNKYSIDDLRKIGGLNNLLKDILKTPSKYKNKKCEWTGVFRGRKQVISFDSKKELNRFLELKNDPTCKDYLYLQERFLLAPKSDTEKAVYYVADFYYYNGNNWVIEDTKGFKTRVYINKRKLVKYKYPEILFIES